MRKRENTKWQKRDSAKLIWIIKEPNNKEFNKGSSRTTLGIKCLGLAEVIFKHRSKMRLEPYSFWKGKIFRSNSKDKIQG